MRKSKTGKYDRRITLQSPTPGPATADGTATKTYTNGATIWASFNNFNGREFFQAQATNSELSGIIEVRYMPGITPDMRAVYQGKIFEITAVIDVKMEHRELQLHVKEVFENG
jgi:SPP1 family predicted phage head-tail adaptor